MIEKVPNRLNIKYNVQLKPTNIEAALSSLVYSVQEHGIKTPKTIIFCQT